MRNFLLGCCCGLFVGVLVATWGWSVAQEPTWNPYSPGSWQSEQRQLEDARNLEHDQYLQRQQLNNLREQQWQQNFSRSLERSFDMQERARAERSADDAVLQGMAERQAAQLRALQAETDAKNRALDRLEREVERMEMQNEIDRLKRGR